MTSITRILKNLIRECQEDYLGLWRIARRAQDIARASDDVRPMTLELVRRILTDRRVKIVIGNFSRRGFRPWTIAIPEALSRIEKEWERLGRTPNIGDIAWLTAVDNIVVSDRPTGIVT